MDKHNYEQLEALPEDEKSSFDSQQTTVYHKTRHPALELLFKAAGNRIFIVVGSLTLASVVGLVIFFVSRGWHSSDSHPQHYCGNTAVEARAAGCTWDQLMWAWYPPHCPHYANEEFIAADDWKFFSDPWGTVATNDEWEQGLNNEIQLFSRHGEHLTHCLYLFLSVGQVLRDGGPATPKLRNYEHLHHCVKMLLPVVHGHENYTLINTKNPKVSYEEYC